MYIVAKVDDLNIVVGLGDDLTHANDVANMFKNNVKYVKSGWSNAELKEATATVVLADEVSFESSGSDNKVVITIAKDAPIGAVQATTEAFVDIAKLKESHAKQLEQFRKELQLAQSKNVTLQEEVNILTDKLFQGEENV